MLLRDWNLWTIFFIYIIILLELIGFSSIIYEIIY